MYEEEEELELRICPLSLAGGFHNNCERKDCVWFMGDECAIVKIAKHLEKIATIRVVDRKDRK